MKLIVCIKQIPDTEARLRIRQDGLGLDERELKYVMSPYDEFAVEECLRIREARGGTVTAVCLGPERARLTLRDALAMGADDAILIRDDAHHRDGLSTAQALGAVLRETPFDVAFFGRNAGDLDNAQVPSRVAELLGLPCLVAVQRLEVGEGVVTARRNIEGGAEVLECPLPVVISADEFLNEPRYASLKGIMGAKKKSIVEREMPAAAERVRLHGLRPRPERKGGRVIGQGVDAVPELVRLLRDEAKVI